MTWEKLSSLYQWIKQEDLFVYSNPLSNFKFYLLQKRLNLRSFNAQKSKATHFKSIWLSIIGIAIGKHLQRLFFLRVIARSFELYLINSWYRRKGRSPSKHPKKKKRNSLRSILEAFRISNKASWKRLYTIFFFFKFNLSYHVYSKGWLWLWQFRDVDYGPLTPGQAFFWLQHKSKSRTWLIQKD